MQCVYFETKIEYISTRNCGKKREKLKRKAVQFNWCCCCCCEHMKSNRRNKVAHMQIDSIKLNLNRLAACCYTVLAPIHWQRQRINHDACVCLFFDVRSKASVFSKCWFFCRERHAHTSTAWIYISTRRLCVFVCVFDNNILVRINSTARSLLWCFSVCIYLAPIQHTSTSLHPYLK